MCDSDLKGHFPSFLAYVFTDTFLADVFGPPPHPECPTKMGGRQREMLSREGPQCFLPKLTKSSQTCEIMWTSYHIEMTHYVIMNKWNGVPQLAHNEVRFDVQQICHPS